MTAPNDLVDAYLQRLRSASADLPEATRIELIDNITAHLAETAPVDADEATVRQALDELGGPEAIASAARAEVGSEAPDVAAPARPPGDSDAGRLYDVATILVLLFGGVVVPVIGWVGGVVMLWAGPRWTPGEKVVGTAVMPIAAAVLFLLMMGAALDLLALIVSGLMLAPAALVAFIVLLRRARSRAESGVALVGSG